MITTIRGRIEAIGSDWVDTAIGGVTLRISVPGSTADQLGQVGSQAQLFTSLQVREDSVTLYGFATQDARTAFETLLGISGVGPKVALSILTQFSPDDLALAVDSGEVEPFSIVPGVGKKTASRIVLELAGKLAPVKIGAGDAPGVQAVVEALTALGYSQAEARDAALALPSGDSMPLEERVRLALQQIGER